MVECPLGVVYCRYLGWSVHEKVWAATHYACRPARLRCGQLAPAFKPGHGGCVGRKERLDPQLMHGDVVRRAHDGDRGKQVELHIVHS